MESHPLRALFFRTENNREPVREWLKEMGRPGSAQIGECIGIVQRGWPIGMPVCRAMGNGLYEIRCSLSDGRIARVLFCFNEGKIILLHGFFKKSQKTPATDLEIARTRQKQYLSHTRQGENT